MSRGVEARGSNWTLASRAPSVLPPGDADLPEHDGAPGAAKKQGGGALPAVAFGEGGLFEK